MRNCHNCDGLGFRREANGEPISCDLCEDALEAIRQRIERALREHFEGGDLWLTTYLAAKDITAVLAATGEQA